jgi:hypothetical protein
MSMRSAADQEWAERSAEIAHRTATALEQVMIVVLSPASTIAEDLVAAEELLVEAEIQSQFGDLIEQLDRVP